MKQLIELAILIKKSKFKSAGLLELVLEQGSLMHRLFSLIAEEKEDNSINDAYLLEQFPEFKGATSRLNSLKSHLKKRLLDIILLLDFDQPDYTNRQKAFNECHRRYAAIMVLMAKGKRQSAMAGLEELLRKTLHFEFTELSMAILRNLSQHYAFVEGASQKYKHAEEQLVEQAELYEAEIAVERRYKDLVHNMVRQKASKNEIQRKAAEYVQINMPLVAKHHAYWIQLLGRLTEIALYDIKGDHETVVRLAEEGLLFFKQKPYQSDAAFQALQNNLFEALFSMKDYGAFNMYLGRHEENFDVASFNWFKLQELVFLKAMHMGQYEKAASVRCTVMKHPAYEEQSAPVWEIWKIFDAYLAYLAHCGYLPYDACSLVFRPGKFANEIKFYAQDKSGMNVSVLLIQFLFDLLEQQWDKILNRVEAFSKYRYRYLMEVADTRVHTFIYMLEQIPKANFNAENTAKRTENASQTLKNAPWGWDKRNYETEVIPYEALWEMIVKKLPSKTPLL